MQTMPGQPRGSTRLARVFGLDGNPLRRASDRAETWTRIGLLAIFLIAGPIAALGAAGWASHTGATAPRVHAAQTHHVRAAAFQPALAPTYLNRAGWGSQAWAGAGTRWESRAASAGSTEALAVVMALAFMALGLMAALRLTLAFLTSRRLAAWEAAWSRVGPQWSGGRT